MTSEASRLWQPSLKVHTQTHKAKIAISIHKVLKQKDSHTQPVSVTNIASLCHYFGQRAVSFPIVWS